VAAGVQSSGRQQLIPMPDHVEDSVTDSANIRAAMKALQDIQHVLKAQLARLSAT